MPRSLATYYESESETDGKPNNVKIGVLSVWQKHGGNWKLLARRGYKLAWPRRGLGVITAARD
jgi:hypothetical protein